MGRQPENVVDESLALIGRNAVKVMLRAPEKPN